MNGRRLTPLLLAATLFAAACGSSAAPAAPSSAPATPAPAAPAPSSTPAKLTPVTLQLSYFMSGYNGPFVLAKEKGYYKDAGFDVKIVEGRGAGPTVGLVGQGGYIFGEAAVEPIPSAINGGAPIKVVAVFVHKSPLSFIYHAATPIQTPKDLVGKHLYSFPNDPDVVMLPAVLSKFAMKTSDVDLRMVNPATYAALFAKDPQGVILGFASDDYETVKSVNPDAKDKLYSDFGPNVYDVGILASDEMIRDHPDAVKAFVAASAKGWQEAIANPDEVGPAVVKEFPQQKADLMNAEWKDTLPLLYTPATQGKPLGTMDAGEWTQQLDLLKSVGAIKEIKPLSDYYTDAFVPAS